MMAMRSGAFGSCAGGIDVLVGMENRGVWLCCGWNCLLFFWRGKWLNICVRGGRWWQVLELVLGAFGVIEELKNPCVGRGLMDKFCFLKCLKLILFILFLPFYSPMFSFISIGLRSEPLLHSFAIQEPPFKKSSLD